MSTNNNRLGKEIRPLWIDQECSSRVMKKFSGEKLQRLISNKLSEITALSLQNRQITLIEDFQGLEELRRLDLSENLLKRLHCLQHLPKLSLLSLASNHFEGFTGLEELRYLAELRTLNINNNPNIKHIQSHVLKPLRKLQALVASDCGLTKITFLKELPSLNTLVLSKNSIDVINPLDLQSLSLLTKLSLGYNNIKKLPDLNSCKQLLELRINHNEIEEIPSSILNLHKLKVFDISNNKISDWKDIQLLSQLQTLTNLSVKNNLLPSPTESVEDIEIREDVAAEKLSISNEEKLYRKYVLFIFQKLVGKNQKPKVQLIVLDNKRVKSKWSHHEGVEPHNSKESNATTNNTMSSTTSTSPTTLPSSNKRKADNNINNHPSKKKTITNTKKISAAAMASGNSCTPTITSPGPPATKDNLPSPPVSATKRTVMHPPLIPSLSTSQSEINHNDVKDKSTIDNKNNSNTSQKSGVDVTIDNMKTKHHQFTNASKVTGDDTTSATNNSNITSCTIKKSAAAALSIDSGVVAIEIMKENNNNKIINPQKNKVNKKNPMKLKDNYPVNSNPTTTTIPTTLSSSNASKQSHTTSTANTTTSATVTGQVIKDKIKDSEKIKEYLFQESRDALMSVGKGGQSAW